MDAQSRIHCGCIPSRRFSVREVYGICDEIVEATPWSVEQGFRRREETDRLIDAAPAVAHEYAAPKSPGSAHRKPGQLSLKGQAECSKNT